MSRWLVGSSRTSKVAGVTMNSASATRAFSPPLRKDTFLWILSPWNRNRPSRALSSLKGLSVPDISRVSMTERSGSSVSAWFWEKKLGTTLCSPRRTWPLSGFSWSRSRRRNVLLPHPLGPTNATLSPRSTTRLAFSNRTLFPYPCVRFSALTTTRPLLPMDGNLYMRFFSMKGFSTMAPSSRIFAMAFLAASARPACPPPERRLIISVCLCSSFCWRFHAASCAVTVVCFCAR
mmetsp:Transcript_38686/g.74172  ORF Transcript_38686/g.74172 Transcript_38686/m.74172 type:complete len:234 (-) Transcript_38686:1167-1868(-)